MQLPKQQPQGAVKIHILPSSPLQKLKWVRENDNTTKYTISRDDELVVEATRRPKTKSLYIFDFLRLDVYPV